MSDLVAFLRARIDEDEKRAERGGRRRLPGRPRALREVEAKRAILTEIESELADDPTVVMPQDRLRVLAAVYRDHPDYRQEWDLER